MRFIPEPIKKIEDEITRLNSQVAQLEWQEKTAPNAEIKETVQRKLEETKSDLVRAIIAKFDVTNTFAEKIKQEVEDPKHSAILNDYIVKQEKVEVIAKRHNITTRSVRRIVAYYRDEHMG